MSAETETTKPTSAVKEISIDPANFDRTRVVIHDAKTSTFNIGDAPVSNTTSEGRYLDDDGTECELFFPAPPQNCFGVNYVYDMNVKKEDQIPENAKGLQICYPATSMKTSNAPTPQEQAFLDLVQTLWELAVEKGRQEVERDDTQLPAPSVASCMAAEKKKKMDLFVKPPLEYPKEKGKKTLDKTKPKRMYVKLVTSGKGPTLKAATKFYGPGDKLVSAIRYVDARGIIEPCFKWEGVYWGAHGPTSPHGASLRFKLVEANYTPQSSASVPQRRMLGKNNAPPEEDDDSNYQPPTRRQAEEEGDGEAEGFSEPGSDDANPAAALAASAGKKPVAKPPVRVAAAKPAVKVTAKGPVAAAKKAPAAAPAKKAPGPSKPAAPKPKAPVAVKKTPQPPPEPEPEPEAEAPQEEEVPVEDEQADDS